MLDIAERNKYNSACPDSHSRNKSLPESMLHPHVVYRLQQFSRHHFTPRVMQFLLLTFWKQHGIALLWYAFLSILLSWPLLPHFAERLPGEGADPRHNLWILWHTKEVIFGRQPLFFAPLLFYPRGISLLTHGLGPVTGILALPFWIWGPEAAHNGTILASFTLTGYCMYLLARGLGFGRSIALFAGTMLLASPLCLAGLLGHITKIFLGGLPLFLLTLHYTLQPRRSHWWAGAAALALILVLLHSGYQFVFAGLSLGFFVGAAWLSANKPDYWTLFKRTTLLTVSASALVLPLLVAILLTARDPALSIDRNQVSADFDIDLLHFLLPPFFSQSSGDWTQQVYAVYGLKTHIDAAVSLAWIGLVLCLITLLFGDRLARRWFLFTLICILLSLGPSLRVAGKTAFTEYNLPIILPYAFVTMLPGLEFIRLPTRFMMMGFVGFGITASYGLALLTRQRTPLQRHLIVLLAITLVLWENWPQPWRMIDLPPVPTFYQQIAGENEDYGVFDLPISPDTELTGSYIVSSAQYQLYQMTHHKGIASGYISRGYRKHPLFADVIDRSDYRTNMTLNGQSSIGTSIYQRLVQNHYRYVVWHKTLYPHMAGEQAARDFLEAVFPQRSPMVDDAQVQVYEVLPAPAHAILDEGRNWSQSEESWRWATSPASLVITAPSPQPVSLQIVPATIYDPQSPTGFGNWALLTVQSGDTFSTTVEIIADQMTTIPLMLQAGTQEITLTLPAGNFRAPDGRMLSFAIRSINLQVHIP